jgi:hypothetical protein
VPVVYWQSMAGNQKLRKSLAVEFDRESDGRWIAEVPKLPGVIVYGSTK